jgi:hypothetical protein
MGIFIMAITKKIGERRQHKRFQGEDGALAVLRPPWPHSTILGQIIDISMGGLAFRCIVGEGWSYGSCELSIAFADHGFYLSRVPVKTVSDFEIARMPFASMAPRRRSVQFGEMTHKQVSHLKHFIQNHTMR